MFSAYGPLIRSVMVYAYPSFCKASSYLHESLCKIYRHAFKMIICDDVAIYFELFKTLSLTLCEFCLRHASPLQETRALCVLRARRRNVWVDLLWNTVTDFYNYYDVLMHHSLSYFLESIQMISVLHLPTYASKLDLTVIGFTSHWPLLRVFLNDIFHQFQESSSSSPPSSWRLGIRWINFSVEKTDPRESDDWRSRIGEFGESFAEILVKMARKVCFM